MKNLPALPARVLVTKNTPTTVIMETRVRIQEVRSMVTNTTTRVTTLETAWGRDWEIICRRVSMSLV